MSQRRLIHKFVGRIASWGAFNFLSDERYIKLVFWARIGRKLNLDNPQTFNEKLQWLKLYDRRPEYTRMVDKYEAKKYVAEIIGDEYIIPTLGVWDRFEDIDFDSLPNQFVLKCTHDSGGLVICRDKSTINVKEAKRKINKSLRTNFYLHSREWPYKNVKPRIIAEQYMEDTSTAELRDYKFFCFNGLVKCYKVDFDRFISHKANYFTSTGELMTMGEEICPPDFEKIIRIPENLGLMETLASELSRNQPFLRTDFYDVDGKVYFGELTFYPASGFGKFIHDGNDELLGSWMQLPKSLGGYCMIYRGLLCVLKRRPQEKIVQSVSVPLNDYKIYTFNGRAMFCMVNQDRGIHTKADYFDKNYSWLDFSWGYDHAEVLPKKPRNYRLMFELAEILSVGTAELRVDFYEINEHVYFGELTFFDGGGFDRIEPIDWDYRMGSMITLPEKNFCLIEEDD